MVQVGVFTTVKNEGLVFPAWFSYHAALFGAHNIFIIDNGSTDEEFLSQLSGVKLGGSHVRIDANPKAFLDKGEYLVRWANEMYQNGIIFDFYLFLDADEFLFVDSTHPLKKTYKDSLMHELRRLVKSPSRVFRIRRGYANIPESYESYLISGDGAQKVIVRSSALPELRLDHGYHCYNWGLHEDDADGLYIEHTNLCFLHFNNKPWEQFRDSAISKLSQFVNPFDREALSQYNGPGVHLVRPLVNGPSDYRSYIASKATSIRINHQKVISEVSTIIPLY